MIDEGTLRRLYLEEQLSIRAIAQQEQLSVRAIYNALIQHHIPRRPAAFRSTAENGAIDPVTLQRLYIDEQLSVRAIAELAHVSARTVYDALVHSRIPRRTPGHRRKTPLMIATPSGLLDAAALCRLYVEEKRSISEIAQAYQCSEARIRRALLRANIKPRRRGRRSN